MKIGLIIAIERELKAFLEYGSKNEEMIINNRKVYKTSINNHDIYAIKSGCGIIDSSSATQLLITKFDVKLVLNFGVTGALERGLQVSDLFVVRKVLNYDFDVSPIDNVKKYQYEEFDDEFIPMSNKYIDFVKAIYPNILEATVASGGKFIEDKQEKQFLNSLGCNICDMEIAGIMRVCYLSNIECLSIKCISDTFDGDGGDFNSNVINSAKKAFDVIIKLINVL
ncbi:MAG: 5'-methylthioadenosine/S-adenosylhomocysteine nucleosidase [Anaeroplasmataceae bacterium]